MKRRTGAAPRVSPLSTLWTRTSRLVGRTVSSTVCISRLTSNLYTTLGTWRHRPGVAALESAHPAKLIRGGVLGLFLWLVARLVAGRVVYDGPGERVQIASGHA
jgi:hypothetical protein